MGGEIVASADEVEGRGCGVFGLLVEERVEQHAVDGEVAAEDIFLRIGGEADGVGAASVGVGSVMAEGGYLDGDVVFIADQDYAEVGADCEGLREEGLDDVGGGAGGYVEIFGGEVEEEVADAASGEVGGVALGAEGFCDGEGGVVVRVGVQVVCHRLIAVSCLSAWWDSWRSSLAKHCADVVPDEPVRVEVDGTVSHIEASCSRVLCGDIDADFERFLFGEPGGQRKKKL